jgi:GNAT superfamily N-acetyltransferase
VGTAAGPAGAIRIRDAVPEDWPAIWPFMREIVAAGETFSWDTDTSEEEARAGWLRLGPGAHVATASFMVDPRRAGRGAGRALGEYVLDRARAEGFRAMQFNAVAESNVRAVRLWQSLGMQILATIPEGFRHPAEGYVGLHIMYLRLRPA